MKDKKPEKRKSNELPVLIVEEFTFGIAGQTIKIPLDKPIFILDLP